MCVPLRGEKTPSPKRFPYQHVALPRKASWQIEHGDIKMQFTWRILCACFFLARLSPFLPCRSHHTGMEFGVARRFCIGIVCESAAKRYNAVTIRSSVLIPLQ